MDVASCTTPFGKRDLDLVLLALETLLRERLSAFHVASAAAREDGHPAPSLATFGLVDILSLCRRLGAEPQLPALAGTGLWAR